MQQPDGCCIRLTHLQGAARPVTPGGGNAPWAKAHRNDKMMSRFTRSADAVRPDGGAGFASSSHLR